jgi:UDP-N-acetylglucosamine 2-epimerase (non-hydrolysing)
MKILHVAGARPNFIKIASVIRACNQEPDIKSILVHTGQHYSAAMSKAFFDELEIPKPDINLEVGSASHAQQTAEIMKRFEPVVLEHKPDAILVVGDVNSTVACVLVAVKLGIKTIHVEAGLRSFDRSMPEEVNRVLTDAVSEILFVTEPSGVTNLRNEGVDDSKVHFVGNVMIDTLERNRTKAAGSAILDKLGLSAGRYGVMTLHRPSNVDNIQVFSRILDAMEHIQKQIKLVFPVHPRTFNNLRSNGAGARLDSLENIVTTDPMGYLDFLKLMSESKVVITDSGGMQEETTILGIPCLTIRENTERPVTIIEGTNRLVGTNTENIIAGYEDSMKSSCKKSRPKYWDGKASDRIVQVLLNNISCNSGQQHVLLQ